MSASGPSTSSGSESESEPPREYDPLLEDLDAAIAEARRKVESGRVRNAENERVRQGWIKTLAYACNVRRQCTNDAELEDLRDRIEALED